MSAVDSAVRRRPRLRRRALGFWLPLALIVLVAAVLVTLNQGAVWGWIVILGVPVVLVVFRLRLVAMSGLRLAGGWVAVAVALVLVALSSHPSPTQRPAAGADSPSTDVVQTRSGPVSGILNEDEDVEIFAGVPYAAPPVGDLRWRAPKQPEPWTDVLKADRFSRVPIQPSSSFLTRALSTIKDVPIVDTLVNPYPTSEDSLYLNVWTPKERDGGPLPVLVYVPGGGFATGSGALPMYDGEALASRGDVITVTINYRLGVLGFLSHPDLATESEYGTSGNYGLMDQVAALQWVEDNITEFGGDPNRVTVAGESAGGESVCHLSASPLTEDLVDGVISGSGSCMGTVGDTDNGDQMDTADVAEEAGTELADELDGASIDQMREMSADEIVEAAGEVEEGHWRPSLDGHVLTAPGSELYAAGQQHDIPILVGNTADEASLTLLSPPDTDPDEYRREVKEDHGSGSADYLRMYPGDNDDEVLESTMQSDTDRIMSRGSQLWSRLQSETGTADAFRYYFTRVPPEDGLEDFGAYHGAELMYAFDTLGSSSDADYTDADYRLRDVMSNYWVNFVKTGDPNGEGLPRWSTVRDDPERVMELGTDSMMISRPRPAEVDFWVDWDGPVA